MCGHLQEIGHSVRRKWSLPEEEMVTLPKEESFCFAAFRFLSFFSTWASADGTENAGQHGPVQRHRTHPIRLSKAPLRRPVVLRDSVASLPCPLSDLTTNRHKSLRSAPGIAQESIQPTSLGSGLVSHTSPYSFLAETVQRVPEPRASARKPRTANTRIECRRNRSLPSLHVQC